MSVSQAVGPKGERDDSSGAGGVASAAKEQASQLGSEVGEQAKAVAGETSQQVRATVDEARQQVRRLARQTQDEVLSQVDNKSGQAAAGLRSVAGQLQAIADGRTSEAGPFTGYAQQAAERVGTIAERLQSNGARGVVDDVTDLARRRPGLFLIGAVGAGFLAGRLLRSGKAAIDAEDEPRSSAKRACFDTWSSASGRPRRRWRLMSRRCHRRAWAATAVR